MKAEELKKLSKEEWLRLYYTLDYHIERIKDKLYDTLAKTPNRKFYQLPWDERFTNKYYKKISVEWQMTPYIGLNYLEDELGYDAGTYIYDGEKLIAYIPGEELLADCKDKKIYIRNHSSISFEGGSGYNEVFLNGKLIDEYEAYKPLFRRNVKQK